MVRRKYRGSGRTRNLLIVILAVLLLVSAAAAGKLLRQNGLLQPLRYTFSDRPFQFGMVETPETLDPALMSRRCERMVGINLYEGLISFDPDTLEPRPQLASSWKVSNDARVFIFKLRKDVKFHSGRPMTAKDVKDSWERVLDPAVNSPARELLLPIKGAQLKAEGKADSVAGIEVLGEWELRITLEEPNAGFLSRFGMPPFWVVDLEAVRAEGKKFGSPGGNSPGTGPFRLQDWQKDKAIILAANSGYWGRNARLSQIVFNFLDAQTGLTAFKEGRLDYLDEISGAEYQELAADPNLGQMLRRTSLLDSYFYQFNLQDPIWGESVILRQALNWAINRDAIIDRLFGGVGQSMTNLMPTGFWGYQPETRAYGFDQSKATQLLAEAGYPGGKSLPPLELAFNNSESHRLIAEELKQQLAQIGIVVHLRSIPWENYQKGLNKGEYSCFRGGWSWEYPDPDDLFFFNFHSSQIGNTNYSFYHNRSVDELLTAARMEIKKPNRRLQYYLVAEKQVIADAPLLWLFAWERVGLIQPKVYNLKLTALDLVSMHQVGLLE
ncbi:MAG: ABC transporter substrate-binding protein [Bacillota bacterium]